MKKEYFEPKHLLPDWGPYSKKYMGISRIVPEAPIQGARFDCVVHPMLANSNQPVPNVTVPSSYHVWDSAPDLSFVTYRVELEWKDQVYADVSFVKVDEETRLIRTEYVNNTDLDQICVLNYYLAMEYPWKQYEEICCDGPYTSCDFTAYDAMDFARPKPWDHLMPDGLHRCEFFDSSFVNGHGFGDRTDDRYMAFHETVFFGEEQGDYVILTVPALEQVDTLSIRYRTTGKKEPVFSLYLHGSTEMQRDVIFPVSDALTILQIPIERSTASEMQIKLVSHGKGGIEFDFAAFHESCYPLSTRTLKPEFVPECLPSKAGYELKYKNVGQTFGFLPLTDMVRIREIHTGCLEDALISRLSQADPTFDHVTETFTSAFKEKKSDDGFYQNFIVHSIFIPAGERHIEYALIGDGKQTAISRKGAEVYYQQAKTSFQSLEYLEDGQQYLFSNRLLRATLLTNVVYPIYRHGDWIKHHTPGKRWDSLYTWDSGFIGLGLLETETELAEYVLDLYLSQPENEDFAFLMHGSPVPVQVYLYLELLQRSKDKEKLLSWYPRMKRYYNYMAGKAEGSSTDPFSSRLTTTFDYFYNCSGMDDLPPQVAMYKNGLQADCAPALTTSQLIRMAKILRILACEQGIAYDIAELDEDIALRSNALQSYSWDEESGYFGYVVHDEKKDPVGIFRTEAGENLSKGMDGIYPLIAGICTPKQEKLLLGHIFSEKEMFSRVGISAVDMTASYYEPNGYWNGNVWFSHQWFIWKTMFDLGRAEEAYKIAKTALDSWQKEVDHSYYTFEMLNITTGRGGWFHQFGGLSSPVNIWANAYYKPGTVTVGFNTWIHTQSYDVDTDTFKIQVTSYADRETVLLAVGKGSDSVKAYLNGKEIPVQYRTMGAVEIMLPSWMKKDEIIIKG